MSELEPPRRVLPSDLLTESDYSRMRFTMFNQAVIGASLGGFVPFLALKQTTLSPNAKVLLSLGKPAN